MLRHQLKTFLTVCDTGSFTKAAAALYITPSAVLQQIQTLETEFRMSLFNRTSKGVSLTQAGEFLELRGRALSHMSEELRLDMQSFVSNAKPICVGTSIMEKIRLLYELWVLFSAGTSRGFLDRSDLGRALGLLDDRVQRIAHGIHALKLQVCCISRKLAKFDRVFHLFRRKRRQLHDLDTAVRVLDLDGSSHAEIAAPELPLRFGAVEAGAAQQAPDLLRAHALDREDLITQNESCLRSRLRDPEAVPLRTHTIFHRGVAIVDPVVAVETQVTILHVRRELMKRAGKHLERKRVIAVMREDIGSVLVGHEAALPSGKADIVVVYALDHDLKDLIQVDRILLKWGIEIAVFLL